MFRRILNRKYLCCYKSRFISHTVKKTRNMETQSSKLSLSDLAYVHLFNIIISPTTSQVLAQLSFEASRIIQEVYNSPDLGKIMKGEDDPTTKADLKIQSIIFKSLSQHFPTLKLIGLSTSFSAIFSNLGLQEKKTFLMMTKPLMILSKSWSHQRKDNSMLLERRRPLRILKMLFYGLILWMALSILLKGIQIVLQPCLVFLKELQLGLV